jgi:hypothetical protein
MPYEVTANTNSERSVRFSEHDYEDYCPPEPEAISFDRFSPKILKNLMLPFSGFKNGKFRQHLHP